MKYDAEDAVASLRKAKNINAAAKNFLKREIKNDDAAARFVKDLRDGLMAAKPDRVLPLVSRNIERYTWHLLGIGRYAFSEVVLPVTEEIVTTYADDFNKTYERKEKGIVVTVRSQFEKIVRDVAAKVSAAITAAGLSATPYMQAMILVGIFEEDVLREAEKVLETRA